MLRWLLQAASKLEASDVVNTDTGKSEKSSVRILTVPESG